MLERLRIHACQIPEAVCTNIIKGIAKFENLSAKAGLLHAPSFYPPQKLPHPK